MTVLVLILLALAAGFAFSTFKIIGQAEVMVIERLGRFHRVARSRARRRVGRHEDLWRLRNASGARDR